jgi:hypothetical protein
MIAELKDLKTKLKCQLFQSGNSPEEHIRIRSAYYKADYELFLFKKQIKMADKLAKHAKKKAKSNVLPLVNTKLITLPA